MKDGRLVLTQKVFFNNRNWLIPKRKLSSFVTIKTLWVVTHDQILITCKTAPDTLVVFDNSTAYPSFNLIFIVKKATIGLTMLTSWFSGPVHGDLDTLGVDGHHGWDAADHDHQVKALQISRIFHRLFLFLRRHKVQNRFGLPSVFRIRNGLPLTDQDSRSALAIGIQFGFEHHDFLKCFCTYVSLL